MYQHNACLLYWTLYQINVEFLLTIDYTYGSNILPIIIIALCIKSEYSSYGIQLMLAATSSEYS